VRLVLTESVVLWLTGGALGLLIADGATRMIGAALADDLPRIYSIGLDFRVVLFTLLVALITGILFGLLPALRSVRPDLQGFLKEGSRTSTGARRQRLRSSLVIAEVTLSVTLLVGAGLTVRSLSQMVGTSPGLDVENVLTADVSLPEARYPEESQYISFFAGLLEEIRALPGVLSASSTLVVPIGPGGWQTNFYVEGTPGPETPSDVPFTEATAVHPDYFATMGIPLLQGRDLSDRDEADAPRVAVIDRTFAEQFWPEGEVIGKRLKFGSEPDSENPWMEVVGVVGHVKLNGVREDALRQIYLPFSQNSSRDTYLVVKTAGDPFTFVEPIRQLVNARDPDLPLSDIQTMLGYLSENTRGDQLMTVLMSVFAATALLLAATGIYAVMSYTTVERLHEMGIRLALGARAGQVVGMVVRQGMIRVGIGAVVGLAGAVGVGQLMESTLFGVTPLDPPTFVAAPVFLVLVAVVATLLPALRATAVDPVDTLRQE